jgi:hypothetical protein
MKLSEVFRKAGKRIERGTNDWICSAIDNVKGATWAQKARAHDVVMRRLGDSAFYEGWLRIKHPELYALRDREPGLYRRKVKEARAAWCKALAEEFKEH